MKKTLVVVALVATTLMPALPVSAADMPAAEAAKVPAVCFFLPLLPKCITAWKGEADAMKAKMMKK